MVKFLNPLRVEKTDDGKWRLYDDFCFLVGERVLCVPRGFTTDFASVPRLPFAYLLAGNTSHQAAVIHDWMYAEGFDRKLADDTFYEAMKAEGLPYWRRMAMWLAVRVAGSWIYDAKRKAD